MIRRALLSPCGLYRLSLSRVWKDGPFDPALLPFVLFIGVNPSKADAEVDDASIRKMRGFCDRWGFSAFVVVNLFSYRATDVRELSIAKLRCEFSDLVLIAEQVGKAALIVPCWGRREKIPKHLRGRIETVNGLLQGRGSLCLGKTAGGDPRHPLMLHYSTPLEPYV